MPYTKRRPPSQKINAELTAGVLRNILLDAGTLFGLAGVIYMLAPRIGGRPGPMESPSLAQAPDA